MVGYITLCILLQMKLATLPGHAREYSFTCGLQAFMRITDKKHNAVLVQGPYVTSATARGFHEAAFVADLHADPLLWGRDLRQRYSRGHMDLPRLRDGGVDLQVFSVVSDVSALLFIASLR